MKKITLLFAILISMNLIAQDTQTTTIEMADGLYQSGKIYVVVGVISIIFIGIVTYLIMLDRKISKLENEIKNK
jgi:CcmD family protein